jgi:hypothetical protein
MKIIKVRPSKKFKGAWEAFEMPGVEAAFTGPDANERAFSYARRRFGGSSGEIHVYDEAGQRSMAMSNTANRSKDRSSQNRPAATPNFYGKIWCR